jgi:polar amino acid transport system substrate-binding protein
MSMRRRAILATPLLLAARHAAAQSAPLTLEQIRRNGKLRIGCEATYPPFTYRDAGVITGYDVELATTMCQALGVQAEFIDTQWSGVIPALYAGRFDIIMSSMSYTRARMERVAFTIPYAEAGQALLIRARDESRIRSMADMGGRSLGVKLGSPGETLHPRLAEAMRGAGAQAFSGVRTYDDHPAAYLALMQGTVDGVLNTLPSLAYVMRGQPGRFSILRGIGADNWAGIALRREDPEVLAWLNERLVAMRADGSLKAMQMKWFGIEFNLPDAIPPLAA